MTTIELDTCNCIIEFTDDDDTLITKIIQECQNHTHTVGESFVGSECHTYNTEINQKLAIPDHPTEQQIQESITYKDKHFIT